MPSNGPKIIHSQAWFGPRALNLTHVPRQWLRCNDGEALTNIVRTQTLRHVRSQQTHVSQHARTRIWFRSYRHLNFESWWNDGLGAWLPRILQEHFVGPGKEQLVAQTWSDVIRMRWEISGKDQKANIWTQISTFYEGDDNRRRLQIYW